MEIAACVAVIDSDGRFVFINSQFQKELKASVIKIMHMTWFDYVHPDDLEICRHTLACCVLTGRQAAAGIRLNDQPEKRYNWEISPIAGDRHAGERFLLIGESSSRLEQQNGFGEPPTRQEQQDKTGLFQARQYEKILDSIGVGIILQDESGKIVGANQKTAELFNVGLRDIYRKNAFEQLWKTTEKNGNPIPFENSPPMRVIRGAKEVSDRFTIHGDGREKRQVVMHSLVLTDAVPDLPYLVISSILDKSEEVRLQALCEERKALFESFANHSPAFGWIVNGEGKVVFANKGLLDFLAVDESGLFRKIEEILPPSVVAAGREQYNWVVENNLPHSTIIKIPNPDKEERVFHVTIFPANNDHALQLIGGQACDITDSYRAKRQRRMVNEAILRAQEQERTVIGQELHDNVNQILFTSKLYLNLIKPLDADQIALKEKTEAFILMAIDEIRKLSSALVSPRLSDRGLIPCIKNLVDDLMLAALFRTDFVVRNESAIDGVDYNIQLTIFRIVQEQVKNIIKYSKAQQVSLQLWTAGEQVHLLIEDDGVGFDPGQATRGIGLTNIYDRASLFNGKVDLQTAPGKGCSLKVTMPLSTAP
jgi:signal transduction histidine kinase